MSVKSYNAAEVVIIFAGIPMEGLADGTFVTVARNNQAFSLAVGSDGEGARAKSNDKSGTITITLMQNSAANDLLSAIANLDEQSGDGVAPFLMKDLSGTTLVAAETAWVQKQADVEFAKEITNREWVLESDAIDMFVGGN